MSTYHHHIPSRSCDIQACCVMSLHSREYKWDDFTLDPWRLSNCGLTPPPCGSATRARVSAREDARSWRCQNIPTGRRLAINTTTAAASHCCRGLSGVEAVPRAQSINTRRDLHFSVVITRVFVISTIVVVIERAMFAFSAVFTRVISYYHRVCATVEYHGES